MPTYAYTCPNCHASFEKSIPIADRDAPQECICGGTATKTLTPLNFVLKGDGWPGKNIKIRGQMAAKNQRLASKERDLPTQRLVPNVGGEETDTWSEAKQLAASKGKDTTGYDTQIRKEKAS